jgi:uncharacterized SAM-binding protein YcdF (DUF218 family)
MWLLSTLATLILALTLWWGRHERSTTRWRVLAVLMLVCGLTAALTIPSPLILKKLVTHLVMPSGLVWIALVGVFVYAIKQMHWRTASLLGAVTALFMLLGNDWCAHRLAAWLEAPYAKITPSEAGHFDAVFVLGGGVGSTPSGGAQLDCAGDRVMLAARMFAAGQMDYVITTGERIEGLYEGGRDPAELTVEILNDLGVPEAQILTIGGRTTSEEMRNIQTLQNEHQWQRLGVITSAGHLPRAMRLAEKAGLQLEPLPSNFEGEDRPWTELSLIPDSAALYTNQKSLKELLARAAGE